MIGRGFHKLRQTKVAGQGTVTAKSAKSQQVGLWNLIGVIVTGLANFRRQAGS